MKINIFNFKLENVEQIIKAYKGSKDKLKIKEFKSIMRSKSIKINFKKIKKVSQIKETKYTINKFIMSKDKSLITTENNQNETQFANVSLSY